MSRAAEKAKAQLEANQNALVRLIEQRNEMAAKFYKKYAQVNYNQCLEFEDKMRRMNRRIGAKKAAITRQKNSRVGDD